MFLIGRVVVDLIVFDLVGDHSSRHRAPLPASLSVGRGWVSSFGLCRAARRAGRVVGALLWSGFGVGVTTTSVGCVCRWLLGLVRGIRVWRTESAGTKSTRTVEGVGCPTVDNLSGSASLAPYLRRSPEGVHVDSWECRIGTAEGKLSETVLVAEGCEATVPVWSVPDHYPKSLGKRKMSGTHAVESRCCCSANGRGSAVGPQAGERSQELLRGLWRAVAPLMAP